jgi:Protein of Unknown function (DUF2784)
MNLDLILAGVVLVIHLLFILWVILGWLLTRHRPVWRWLHIACVLYGVLIEVSGLSCPLTLLEAMLEEGGRMVPYREPFVLHYLEAVVYPNIPLHALVAGAVALCVGVLGVYVRRYRRRDWAKW